MYKHAARNGIYIKSHWISIGYSISIAIKLEYFNTFVLNFTVIPKASVSGYCATDNRSNHVQGQEWVLSRLLIGIIIFVSRAKNEQQHYAVSIERALDWLPSLDRPKRNASSRWQRFAPWPNAPRSNGTRLLAAASLGAVCNPAGGSTRSGSAAAHWITSSQAIFKYVLILSPSIKLGLRDCILPPGFLTSITCYLFWRFADRASQYIYLSI